MLPKILIGISALISFGLLFFQVYLAALAKAFSNSQTSNTGVMIIALILAVIVLCLAAAGYLVWLPNTIHAWRVSILVSLGMLFVATSIVTLGSLTAVVMDAKRKTSRSSDFQEAIADAQKRIAEHRPYSYEEARDFLSSLYYSPEYTEKKEETTKTLEPLLQELTETKTLDLSMRGITSDKLYKNLCEDNSNSDFKLLKPYCQFSMSDILLSEAEEKLKNNEAYTGDEAQYFVWNITQEEDAGKRAKLYAVLQNLLSKKLLDPSVQDSRGFSTCSIITSLLDGKSSDETDKDYYLTYIKPYEDMMASLKPYCSK
jgi:hypothetical protein